jgi:hypothetical protein
MGAIQLSGSIGAGGSFAILGEADCEITGNADLTLNLAQYSSYFLRITSDGASTAVRNVIAPLNKGTTFIVLNETSESPALDIVIKGSTGSGVTIPPNTAVIVGTDGVNYFQPGTAVGTVGNISYGGSLTYNAVSSDKLIVIDSSGWTNQAALQINLPAEPFVTESHTLIEDGYIIGRPPCLVSGNGNPIVPYSQNVQVSKPRASSNLTAITDLGGTAKWTWSGSVWLLEF